MEIKDRITFIDAFKQEFGEYIDQMDEGTKQKWGEYWYHLTLKEGMVDSDFTKKVYPFVNANQKTFDESFEIWVKEFNGSPETAISVTVNPDYGDDYPEWQIPEDNEKDLELTINHQGTEMQIRPVLRQQDNEFVYDCYNGEVMLGTIRPSVSDDGADIVWIASDMPDDLVKLIGEEIERQDG
jgi:hypothetical protein